LQFLTPDVNEFIKAPSVRIIAICHDHRHLWRAPFKGVDHALASDIRYALVLLLIGKDHYQDTTQDPLPGTEHHNQETVENLQIQLSKNQARITRTKIFGRKLKISLFK